MVQPSMLSKENLENFKPFEESFKSLSVITLPVEQQPLTSDEVPMGILKLPVTSDHFLAVASLAEKHQVPTYAIYTAVFKTLLQRYSGQGDIISAQLFFGGDDKNVDISVSRDNFDGNILFTDFLNQSNPSAATNNYTPKFSLADLDRFLADINAKVEVFQTLFLIAEHENGITAGLEKEIEKNIQKFIAFSLGLFINQSANKPSVAICYHKHLLHDNFVAGFQQHFMMLLNGIIERPNNKIGSYRVLTPGEWQKIVVDFNDTITPYSYEKTLFGLFEECVAAVPGQPALMKGDKQMTYAELNQQANRLAHLLISKGVLPGDNIGLLVARDFKMMIGMFGILKAGGAYVPIDPEYPFDRQRYIYENSSLKVVLTDKDYELKTLLGEQGITIDLDVLKAFDDTNPGIKVSSKQTAYTIYTSGSTGRPKGVMVEHHAAVNLVEWVNKTYNVGVGDRDLFVTSMCFDLSVYDIFGVLAAGGTLVIAELPEIQDVKQLQKMLLRYGITFWNSVPTTMDYLVRDLEMNEPGWRYEGLKTTFLSGDKMPLNLPDRIKKFMPQTQVINVGGATEAAVWSNYYPITETSEKWSSIPYGKPIDNNFYYILNEQLQPVPFGVIGEMYIGGVGVARGYANDQAKTDAAFMPDPFNKTLGGRMYRCGDLGKMDADLNMILVGRMDNQVKIRGFRVELGEIESALNSIETIGSGVVLAKNDRQGKKRLIGYVVSKVPFDRMAITAILNAKLPYYMVPSIWIELEKLPLSANGKIDRKALPDVDDATLPEKKFTAPATQTEKLLLGIWEACMGQQGISTNDNFFEIGGHSLIAAQVFTRLKKAIGKTLQLAALFKYPDIQSLARFIDGGEIEGEHIVLDTEYGCLVPIKPTGSKTPLYVVHGAGLNTLIFSKMATLLDKEQPVYGLQARGLNGTDEPLDNMQAIAKDYLDEMLKHNPTGPYVLAGYSFGGYVAVEMQRMLEAMGKELKMLIMFDTNAEIKDHGILHQIKIIPEKLRRNVPRLATLIKLKLTKNAIIRAQFDAGKLSAKESKEFFALLRKIQRKHDKAFRNFKMAPFNDKVYLLRARTNVHYVDDPEFLGWKKYALKGVEAFEVPGDHLSILDAQNVPELAVVLQKILNEYAA